VAVGTGIDSLRWLALRHSTADVERILSAFTTGMKQRFAETCCRLVTRAGDSNDNFLRDFGERFLPIQNCVNGRPVNTRSVR
jgi:hypothetical protein